MDPSREIRYRGILYLWNRDCILYRALQIWGTDPEYLLYPSVFPSWGRRAQDSQSQGDRGVPCPIRREGRGNLSKVLPRGVPEIYLMNPSFNVGGVKE